MFLPPPPARGQRREGRQGSVWDGHLDLCHAAGRCTLQVTGPWAQHPGLALAPGSGLWPDAWALEPAGAICHPRPVAVPRRGCLPQTKTGPCVGQLTWGRGTPRAGEGGWCRSSLVPSPGRRDAAGGRGASLPGLDGHPPSRGPSFPPPGHPSCSGARAHGHDCTGPQARAGVSGGLSVT